MDDVTSLYSFFYFNASYSLSNPFLSKNDIFKLVCMYVFRFVCIYVCVRKKVVPSMYLIGAIHKLKFSKRRHHVCHF